MAYRGNCRGKTVETQAFISTSDTLRQAGHRMRELGVTTLQLRGDDGRPRGCISRDMIVQGIAAGGDPKYMTVGELPPPQPAPPAFPGQRQAA